MKKLTKILVVVLSLALICTGALFAVIAASTEYSGDIANATTKADAINAAEDIEALFKAVENYNWYVTGKSFSPDDAEALATLNASITDKVYSLLTGKLDFIENADENVDGAAMVQALFNIYYVDSMGYVDSSTEGYDAIAGRVEAIEDKVLTGAIAALGTSVEQIIGTGYGDTSESKIGLARNNANLKNLDLLLERLEITEDSEEYAAIAEAIEAAKKVHEEAASVYNKGLEKKIPVGEYFLTTSGTHNMNQGSRPSMTPRSYSKTEYIVDGDNTYLQIKYTRGPEGLDEGSKTSNVIITPTPIAESQIGMVFEMDITSFDYDYNSGLIIQANAGGTYKNIGLLYISKSGGLIVPGTANFKAGVGICEGDTVIDNVIVPGRWTKIAVAYNTQTDTADYYVDGEIVAEDVKVGLKGIAYFPFRIGQSPNTNECGETLAFDNITYYHGTAVRDMNKLYTMTEDEKFCFFAEAMVNEDLSTPDRINAFNEVDALINKYWDAENSVFKTENEEVQLSVNAYLAFDADALINSYMESNLTEYVRLVNEAKKLDEVRSPANIDARKTAIAAADSFLDSCGKYIDVSDTNATFTTANNAINNCRNNLAVDENIVLFVGYMEKFDKSERLKVLEKNLTAANEIVASESFDIALRNKAGYEDFKVAYEIYQGAEAKYERIKRNVTSAQIVGLIEKIKEYPDQEAWDANFEEVNNYVFLVRSFLAEDFYDENYEGFAEALEAFEPANVYFYGMLQKEHAAFLKAQIEAYDRAETYIAKLGVYTYIQKYLRSADIDPENEDVIYYLSEVEKRKNTLADEEENYKAILQENTTLFIKLVDTLNYDSKYVEILAIYDKGLDYYYAMNIDTDEAKAAIATFEEYAEFLKECENNADLFIANVAKISTVRNENDLFKTLVMCAENVEYTYKILDGIAADNFDGLYGQCKNAILTYEAVLNAYNEGVANINGIVDSVNDVIVATRVGVEMGAAAIID